MISVIIPTRNRADLLKACLDSIVNQELPVGRFEVLIIDNGSTDHTCDISQPFVESAANVRYFLEPELGLHAGRHRGMHEALGDILVFVDDDIEAKPGWLAAISDSFNDPEVTMVGGNNLPMFLETPPAWLERMWSQSSYDRGHALGHLSILELSGPARVIDPGYIWGCNFSIRKSVLVDAGGFHPDGMPQECLQFRGDGETHVSRYVKQHKLRCWYHPDATVFHKVPKNRMTYEYFRKRGFAQGISDSFTELREQSSSDKGNTKKLNFNPVKRILKWLKRMIPADAGIQRAHEEFESGYAEGYQFHQNAYQNDMFFQAESVNLFKNLPVMADSIKSRLI
jgi:glycosyltransferase involved in cell wall biosynthesis